MYSRDFDKISQHQKAYFKDLSSSFIDEIMVKADQRYFKEFLNDFTQLNYC